MINKAEIIARLDAIVTTRLFGNAKWPADRETAAVLNRILTEMGLQEELPDDPRITRHTSLGREFNVDLQMAFMGLWELWDMLTVLEEYDLLDEDEFDILENLIELKKYRELKARVQRAYWDYYEAALLH
jgi:hypothetical protein